MNLSEHCNECCLTAISFFIDLGITDIQPWAMIVPHKEILQNTGNVRVTMKEEGEQYSMSQLF